MDQPTLTGAQKTSLRGLGQRLDPALKIGKGGLTHAAQRELDRLLDSRELVKIRFEGADRHARAALIAQIEADLGLPCVGAVGSTALFYRRQADPARRVVEL